MSEASTRNPLVDPLKGDVVRLPNGATYTVVRVEFGFASQSVQYRVRAGGHCVTSIVNWRHLTRGATVVEVGS